MGVGEGEIDEQREALGLHQHRAQLTARIGIRQIQSAERSELNHAGRFAITVASRRPHGWVTRGRIVGRDPSVECTPHLHPPLDLEDLCVPLSRPCCRPWGCSSWAVPRAPDHLTYRPRPALAGASWGAETPNFNLEVILRGDGFGLVKFRQPNDAQAIIYLDPWVRGLVPNTEYLLQRAVDGAVNDDCTSTAWLTLGRGLAPQSIVTDAGGPAGQSSSATSPRSCRGPSSTSISRCSTLRPRQWCCRASATSSGSACSCRKGGAGSPYRSASHALRQNRWV